MDKERKDFFLNESGLLRGRWGLFIYLVAAFTAHVVYGWIVGDLQTEANVSRLLGLVLFSQALLFVMYLFVERVALVFVFKIFPAFVSRLIAFGVYVILLASIYGAASYGQSERVKTWWYWFGFLIYIVAACYLEIIFNLEEEPKSNSDILDDI